MERKLTRIYMTSNQLSEYFCRFLAFLLCWFLLLEDMEFAIMYNHYLITTKINRLRISQLAP